MTKESLYLNMTQFLGMSNKEEVLKLSAELDIGFSFSKKDGSMIFESGFLSEGYRKGINRKTALFVPESEIRNSINNSINKNFPVKFNHDYDTPSPGMVTKLYFDEERKMLVAVGVINHVETAEDIRHITEGHDDTIQVSVTMFGKVVHNKEYNRDELHNLRYNELSIVEEGENPDTFMKMKNEEVQNAI